MKAIWIKLIRDSAFRKTKIFYLFLAQLIGFLGITMVYVGNIMVARDFDENFSKSLPAHLILTYAPDSMQQKAPAIKHPVVDISAQRPMTIGDIQTGEHRYMKALLIGVEDLKNPQVNAFSVKGSCCDSRVYIEQNGRSFFEPEFLENIRIISTTNDTLDLGQTGWVHDTRLPPSRMEHTIYVYLPIEIFHQYFPNVGRRYLLRTTLEASNKQGLQDLGQQITTEWSTQYGIQASVYIPSQDHPHQNIADGIFYLMKLFGGSLGLLGGVFMVLILLTWLDPQIPDIGTLKSMGATRRDIRMAYLLFILLLGLIAWIPAFGLGYKIAEAFNGFIAFTQNFTPVAEPLQLEELILLLLICLSIPLLLAFFPIRKAVQKSVRYAQSRVFSNSQKSIYWLNQHIPTVKWKYMANNVLRNLTLFILTTLLVVCGLAISLTGYNLIYSLQQEMDSLAQQKLYDYALDFNGVDSMAVPVESLPGDIQKLQYVWVEALEVFNPLLDIPVRMSCARLGPAVAVPAFRMIRGQWNADCTDCLYFSQSYNAEFASLEPGDPIKVKLPNEVGKNLIFGGIVKLPESSSAILRPSQVVDRWNQLYIEIPSAENLSNDLKEHFAQEKGEVPHVFSAALTRQMITDHLEGSFFVISGLGLASLLLSLLGMLVLINLNLLRREKDIGILKSLGANPRQIQALFIGEVLLVLGFAIVLGCMFSMYLSQSMCLYFGDMVLHFPLLLQVNWVYALLTIAVYLGLSIWGMRIQIARRLSGKTRYLLG